MCLCLIVLISLCQIAIRTFGSGLTLHFQVDFGVLRDLDTNRLEGIDALSPTLDRSVATGGNRSKIVEIQAQRDQDERNSKDRARDVHQGILDIVVPKECAKRGRHENTVDEVKAIGH